MVTNRRIKGIRKVVRFYVDAHLVGTIGLISHPVAGVIGGGFHPPLAGADCHKSHGIELVNMEQFVGD